VTVVVAYFKIKSIIFLEVLEKVMKYFSLMEHLMQEKSRWLPLHFVYVYITSISINLQGSSPPSIISILSTSLFRPI